MACIKHILFCGIAFAVLHAPTAAHAQNAPADPAALPPEAQKIESAPDDPNAIAEIVVTAQKRLENIQDVPIAVSAFTGETINERAIDDTLDLQLVVPNLLLVGNDRPTLRGVGNNAISPTADNGTGVLFNFAPIGVRPQDEYYDLERIEVLRGPQGTLYGRNTTGGTINLITAKPGREWGGYWSGQFGNYSTFRTHGALNLPIADAVRVRLSGFYLRRDGYTKNVGPGDDIDGRDQFSLRGSLRLLPGPDTTIDLVVQHSKEGSSRSRENKRLCKATPALGCSPVELGFDSPDVSGVIFQSLLRFFRGSLVSPTYNIYAGAQNPEDLRTVATDTGSRFDGKQTTASLEMSHDFGGVTLLSLSGFTKGESEANTDYDNAVLPFRFLRPITYNSSRRNRITTDQLIATDSFLASGRTYYQEFRAVSALDGPLNFIAGANYFDAKGSATFQIYHPAIELLAANILRLPPEAWFFNAETPEARTKSHAVFGELYYDFSDRTKLTVGARYTKDKKSIRTRTIFLSAPPPFTTGSGSYDAVTGRIVLDHELTRDNLVYASFSRGFKGGGLNVGNSGTPRFDPEFINAYELGSKNSFFGRTLQANFSAFYYDYSNLQLGQRLGTSVVTVNSDAKIYGLESEFLWQPVPRLELNANASYLHTRIGELLTVDPANPAQWEPADGVPTRTPAVPVNLDGHDLPYSPKFKVSLGAQYTVPLTSTGWSATLRGDYSRQSSYFAREFNTSNDRIKAWSVTNAIVRVSSPSEKFTIEAYVKNIGNKDNITNSIIESDLVGSYRNARILEPRTFGLTTNVKF